MRKVENYGERPTGKPDEKVEGRLQKAAEALKPLMKKEPQIAANTIFIRDTDELKVWQRKKQKQLVIQFTLDTGPK